MERGYENAGHLAISIDIVSCHNKGGDIKWNPEIEVGVLLNTLQSQKSPGLWECHG
jgi:hypothetical protein